MEVAGAWTMMEGRKQKREKLAAAFANFYYPLPLLPG
jgi:hypothetical protein